MSDRTVGGTERSEKERSAGAIARDEPVRLADEPIPAHGEPKIIRGMEIIDRSEAP